MNYSSTMNAIDTEKALGQLNLEATLKGAYFNFTCPNCQKKAVMKAFGEKKNVWFCPECKSKGNMISLTMMQRKFKYCW